MAGSIVATVAFGVLSFLALWQFSRSLQSIKAPCATSPFTTPCYIYKGVAMADDEHEEQEMELESSKDKQKAEQAKALDSMTDLAPEKQLDENKVKKAMSAFAASQKADKEAQRQREKELAAVKINKDDIDVIANEFEIDKKLAERKLRESNGSLEAALKALL